MSKSPDFISTWAYGTFPFTHREFVTGSNFQQHLSHSTEQSFMNCSHRFREAIEKSTREQQSVENIQADLCKQLIIKLQQDLQFNFLALKKILFEYREAETVLSFQKKPNNGPHITRR